MPGCLVNCPACHFSVIFLGQIPFSGRNPKFNEIVGRMPKILVLNKVDMADNFTAHVQV